jgi:hypothetical protein
VSYTEPLSETVRYTDPIDGLGSHSSEVVPGWR